MKRIQQITVCIGVVAAIIAATAFSYPGVAAKCNLHIHIDNYLGSQLLKMDTLAYVNEMGQPYSVSKLRYYISNVHLKKKDGTGFVSDSCFLVDEEDTASKKIILRGIPEGEYESISFTLGVDSLRNCSGAQSGALDPVNGMFWTWNTGYIFMKLEGKSPASTSPGHVYEFHIGGYKAPSNCIRSINLPFGQQKMVLNVFKGTVLNMKADVAEIMKTPTPVDFSKLSSVTDHHNAGTIADNYTDMFSILDIKQQ